MNTSKQHKTLNHSMADWDFYRVEDWSPPYYHDLVTWTFISPPSCVSLMDPFKEVYILPKHPLTQDLKQGRLTTWLRHGQPGVGNSHFYIGVKGEGSFGIRLSPFYDPYVWYRTRFTWWQSIDAEGNPKTVVFRELWEDDQWTDKGITYHDPMSGSVNRVGVGRTPQALGSETLFDDTIIEEMVYPPRKQ